MTGLFTRDEDIDTFDVYEEFEEQVPEQEYLFVEEADRIDIVKKIKQQRKKKEIVSVSMDENFDPMKLMPDISLMIENNKLPNIPPSEEHSIEHVIKKPGMEWIKKCDFKLFCPETSNPNEQIQELEYFLTKLKEESTVIDKGLCDTFPDDFRAHLLAFDTETTGLNTRTRYNANGDLIQETLLVGLCLATSDTKGYYLPCRHTEDDDNLNWVPEILTAFIDILNEEFCLIIHNSIYDREVIAINGCEGLKPFPHFLDTMLLGFQEEPHENRFGLDAMSKRFLNRGMLDTHELFPENVHKSIKIGFERLPAQNAYVYGCSDSVNTYGLFQALASKENNLFETQPIPVEVDHKMADALRSLYRVGLPVNLMYYINATKDSILRLNLIEDHVQNIVGRKFNLRANLELETIIFDQFKIPKNLPFLKVGKTKHISVDEATLDKLFELYPELDILKLLIQYRKLSNTVTKIYKKSLMNSYVCYYMPWAKVQLQFSMTTVPTARLSSSSNSGAPHKVLTSISKNGNITHKYAKGSGDAGFNSQGINSKPPYKAMKARRILNISDSAGVNPNNPYSEELDRMFIREVAISKDGEIETND